MFSVLLCVFTYPLSFFILLIECNIFPAFWGPATSLLILSYLPAGHNTWAVIILTITVGLNGGHYVGFLVSTSQIKINKTNTSIIGIFKGNSSLAKLYYRRYNSP